MGRIRTSDGTRSWLLTSHQVIGRSRRCQLCVDTPDTSGEHASLRWRSGTWELQDLNSRNGTYVGDRLLGAGRRVRLEEGTRLGFGRPDEYMLFDAGPPEPHAIDLAAQQPTIEARGGLLLLPDAEHPTVMVFRRDSAWWVQRDDEVRPIADGEVVVTSVGSWQLHLPEPVSSTRDAEDAPSLHALRQARLVREETRRRHATLSPQEERVCRLVAAGLLNKQIAGEMGLAEQTVQLYRGRALKKLGVAGVADLVRLLAGVDADD